MRRCGGWRARRVYFACGEVGKFPSAVWTTAVSQAKTENVALRLLRKLKKGSSPLGEKEKHHPIGWWDTVKGLEPRRLLMQPSIVCLRKLADALVKPIYILTQRRGYK